MTMSPFKATVLALMMLAAAHASPTPTAMVCDSTIALFRVRRLIRSLPSHQPRRGFVNVGALSINMGNVGDDGIRVSADPHALELASQSPNGQVNVGDNGSVSQEGNKQVMSTASGLFSQSIAVHQSNVGPHETVSLGKNGQLKYQNSVLISQGPNGQSRKTMAPSEASSIFSQATASTRPSQVRENSNSHTSGALGAHGPDMLLNLLGLLGIATLPVFFL